LVIEQSAYSGALVIIYVGYTVMTTRYFQFTKRMTLCLINTRMFEVTVRITKTKKKFYCI